MKYSEVIFKRRSPEKIYPDVARKIVAAACDGLDIDPAIFNRAADGKTLSAVYGANNAEEGFGVPPRIIFDGGVGFIRMYGIGLEGAKLLDAEAGKIFTALFKAGFIGLDHKDGPMDLANQPYESFYAMRNVVLARNPGACRQFTMAELQGEVAKAAQDVVLRGLNGVARLLDNELISCGANPRFEQALPSYVTFLEAKPITIEIKPGIKGAAYKDILMSMPCKLRGPWATGILRSRGYGLVRPCNPTRAA